jgi:hypothetical protein
LYEWQTFPEQFAKSKHPDEKALYRILTDDVGPQIIEVLEVSCAPRLLDMSADSLGKGD